MKKFHVKKISFTAGCNSNLIKGSRLKKADLFQTCTFKKHHGSILVQYHCYVIYLFFQFSTAAKGLISLIKPQACKTCRAQNAFRSRPCKIFLCQSSPPDNVHGKLIEQPIFFFKPTAVMLNPLVTIRNFVITFDI